jgi:hypothetical protein
MKSHPGVTLVELIVAATLVVSGLTVIGRLSVSTGRMWQQTRFEQFALEELSNQLEHLLALPAEQRDVALSQIVPSDLAISRLPDPVITSRLLGDQAGQRIELQISWNRVGPAKPMSLVGWIDVSDSESLESQGSSQ